MYSKELEYVSEEFQTLELVMIALQQDKDSIYYVKDIEKIKPFCKLMNIKYN